MIYHAQIYVTLRPAVLDPAGTAVQNSLQSMHYQVANLRIGKYIELQLSADDDITAQKQLEQMCSEVLSNPVIETYRYEFTAKS